MNLIDFLALGAGILNAAAFLKYNWEVFFGNTRPNAASWFLWSLITTINLYSLLKMGANWTILTAAISDTSLCTATFLFLLIVGHFGELTWKNWAANSIERHGNRGRMALLREIRQYDRPNPYGSLIFPDYRGCKDWEDNRGPQSMARIHDLVRHQSADSLDEMVRAT